MVQPRSYIQLTQEERDKIAALYAQRVSLSEIARQLQRNKSTISREISRNKAPIKRVNGACRAHNKAKERKIKAGQRPRFKTHRMSKIPERISILERPEAVQQQKQAGHWETDTVIARSSDAALLATVERKSRYTKLAKLKRRTAQQVRIALNRTLSQYGKHLRRTITYDNGQENVEHMIVNKTLGTRSYFCQPYHSREKGTVENTIGIVRRTYPKKTNFDRVLAKDVKRLERKFNNTPRKILHYLTPKGVFDQIVALPH